jgi:hypothetical protein
MTCGDDAVAVDLVKPAGIGRRFMHRSAELGRDLGQQRHDLIRSGAAKNRKAHRWKIKA